MTIMTLEWSECRKIGMYIVLLSKDFFYGFYYFWNFSNFKPVRISIVMGTLVSVYVKWHVKYIQALNLDFSSKS